MRKLHRIVGHVCKQRFPRVIATLLTVHSTNLILDTKLESFWGRNIKRNMLDTVLAKRIFRKREILFLQTPCHLIVLQSRQSSLSEKIIPMGHKWYFFKICSKQFGLGSINFVDYIKVADVSF